MADTRASGGNQLTGRLYVAAAVSAVAAVLYGYDTGIISGALLQIEDDFDIGSTWKQLIAASILLGAIIGALACSRLSERRGRRGTNPHHRGDLLRRGDLLHGRAGQVSRSR